MAFFVQAQPIWNKNSTRGLNENYCFVERFSAVSGKEYQLKITGAYFYRAFLNGKFIGYGPARAAEGYFRVDSFTLTDLQKDNTLFVEVRAYNCQEFCNANAMGFAQYEITCGDDVIVASSEKTCGYECDYLKREVLRFSYQRGFCEEYLYPDNLHKIYSGEALPKTPIAVGIESFQKRNYLPRGTAYPLYPKAAAKKMEQGKFQHADNYLINVKRYFYHEDIGIFPKEDIGFNVNDFLCEQVSKIEPEADLTRTLFTERQYAQYRLKQTYTGFIYLDFETEDDAEVIITFEEVLTAWTEEREPDICFYRNDTQNHIRLQLKAGKQTFRSFEPYSAQYIKVYVRKGNIRINEVGLYKFENPTIDGSKFHVGDEKLDIVVDAAIESLRQNSVDMFTDCPSRERAGWLCDSYFMGKAEQFYTGKNVVERCFLENYAYEPQNPNLPDGMISMCYPAMTKTYIENWSLWYILELLDYYKRTGDRQLIQLSKPKVEGLLRYFSTKENELGLLENAGGWIFIEWSKANDDEFTKGVNFPSNMLYACALDCAAELYGFDYHEKAEKLRDTIRAMSFNGKFFEDNRVRNADGELILKGHTSETCQYYAFFLGIADEKRYPELFDFMFNKLGCADDAKTKAAGLEKSNMFIGYYLRLYHLFRLGRYQQILDESRDTFYNMAMQTGTLWEHSDTRASLCHGFTSFIGQLIYESKKNI